MIINEQQLKNYVNNVIQSMSEDIQTDERKKELEGMVKKAESEGNRGAARGWRRLSRAEQKDRTRVYGRGGEVINLNTLKSGEPFNLLPTQVQEIALVRQPDPNQPSSGMQEFIKKLVSDGKLSPQAGETFLKHISQMKNKKNRPEENKP